MLLNSINTINFAKQKQLFPNNKESSSNKPYIMAYQNKSEITTNMIPFYVYKACLVKPRINEVLFRGDFNSSRIESEIGLKLEEKFEKYLDNLTNTLEKLEKKQIALRESDIPQDMSYIFDELGKAYESDGNTKEAELLFKQALENKIQKHKGQNHPDIAESYRLLANLYEKTGRPDLADIYRKSAMEMLEERI